MSSKRLLLVDDEEDFRITVQAAFEAKGWTVLVAGDGEAALKVLETNEIDVVLTDVRMPKMSGVGLASAIQGLRRGGAAIYLMSAFPELSESLLRGLGVRDVFRKPFLFEDVISRIENTLRKAS